MQERNGIISAGNWIVDYVKVIDRFPSENMLSNILEVHQSVGGGPNNVLTDLAKLDVGIPLYGAGLIGDDPAGKYIHQKMEEYKINSDHVLVSQECPTSFTDAMSVAETGNRTFFHYRGANTLLDVDQLSDIDVNAKMFHLAYLLLLDKLDDFDEDYSVKAARLLNIQQQKGYKTSIDVVSEESNRFKRVIRPCLPYVNYLIINEVEASAISDIIIRDEQGLNIANMKSAGRELIKSGVNDIVIIHAPEGACLVDKNLEIHWVPSCKVEPHEIKGATGAGDAFCAGCLYGIHEGWEYKDILKLAHASARFNLLEPTSTGGAVSLQEIKSYMSENALILPD
ncbi:carbohydrate kinase family protein [Labilibacter sediminis]|nr:carbohydrate kinase family protein [Labilibacter sediminis]